MKLKQILFTYQDTIKDLITALTVSVEKAAQNEWNLTILIKQLEEISETIITIIGIKIDLCIFCKRKRRKT